MKSPLTKPQVPLLCKMEPCEKVLEQTSPKKTPASVAFKPPAPVCVKALSFDACESVKGTHNKENCEDSLSSSQLSCGELEGDAPPPGCGGFQSDSGYVSLDQTAVVSTPPAAGSLLEASPSDPKLPALQFQRAVCRALSKSYGKSLSFDWAVVHSLAGQFGLHNVIGGKMGLEHFDVLQGLLKKDMKHLLTKILLLLGDVDLVNCKKVSRTWRRIISSDPRALRKCKEAEQRLRDSRQLGPLLTRDFTPCRGAFSQVQDLASTPIQRLSRTGHTSFQKSRFWEFQEVGSSVKQHEALKSCKLCGSPARFDPAVSRAVCTRHSCGFVCCTLCQAEYHGSSSCQLAVLRTPGWSKPSPIIGSAQSKRNVKRL